MHSTSNSDSVFCRRTLLLAGHETSATSTLWILLELARHPDVQDRLRSEIRAVEHAVHGRGDSEFTSKDFESMTYTTAVMKEAMRLHPGVISQLSTGRPRRRASALKAHSHYFGRTHRQTSGS